MFAGTGSEVVRYDTSTQTYIVNWRTDQCLTGACTLDPTLSYRLRVLAGALELGHADVVVVSNGSQLKNVQTGQDIGLIDGRTLPVQFRIEQGAVAVVAPGSPTSIGPSGGNIVTSDGHLALAVPAGALAGPTNLTVGTSTSFPTGTGTWSAPVDLGPTGTTFTVPVVLTLSYDPTQLPPGVPPSALSVYVSDGTRWELVPGSSLNAVDNTVSVPISHFSTYTLTIAPTVVNGVPTPTTINVGQSTTLTGFAFIYKVVPSHYCYYVYTGPFSRPRLVCVTYTNTYSYPVQNQAVLWSALPTGTQVISLAATSTHTDQSGATTSPPIKGLNSGAAQIVASLFVASGFVGPSVQSNPVTITVAFIGFAMVTSGGGHNCGLTVGGAAFCWGGNSAGELGNSTTSNSPVPVLVAGGLTFSSVSPGRDGLTCGLTTAGAAYCWGDNTGGQLGNNTTTNSPVPVPVAGGLIFSSVSSGAIQTCGLTPQGAAYCWGRNNNGELGTNSTIDSHVPVAVAGGLTFSSLSSGANHSCAMTVSGVAYCWGANINGQLGNNSTANSLVPVAVAGGLIFGSIGVGYFHTCGVTTTGAAYCWGQNIFGQLGNNSTTTQILVPVAVAGGLTFSSVSGGLDHSCGITPAGAAYCWGRNDLGQLGTGTYTDSHVPVAVVGGLAFRSLGAGASHSCGLTTGGVALCWGKNSEGELGNGSTLNSAVPVKVADQP
jgi:alpha-tubulin suppressor-like RCC1 family protein